MSIGTDPETHSGLSHAERVEIAERVARRVVETYGDAVHAVLIVGSTSKNLDRPYSDLEMIAVVRDGVEIEAKSYVHRGIVVEIDYPQESGFLKSARRILPRWAISADQYRNRIVLFEREDWLRRLDEAVAANDQVDVAATLGKCVPMLVEPRGLLRNSQLRDDTINIRMAGFYIAEAAALVVLLLNRRYVITSSWLFEQAFECPDQPRNFRRLVEVAGGFVPALPGETAGAAEELCDAVLAMIEARGVALQSDQPIV